MPVFLIFFSVAASAQSISYPEFRQKDTAVVNPNANRDLQAVSDYLHALFLGDPAKARGYLTDSCTIFGPAPNQQSRPEQIINEWKENYKTQAERGFGYYHTQTWKNVTGSIPGSWVTVWSEYKCAVGGTRITVPFIMSVHMTDDGKIDWGVTSWDRLAPFEALGYKLTPPAPAKPAKKSK